MIGRSVTELAEIPLNFFFGSVGNDFVNTVVLEDEREPWDLMIAFEISESKYFEIAMRC
jgi:hypothetical protein